MNQSPADDGQRNAERLNALEMLVTHLERTLGQLDEALREANDRVDQLERRLSSLGNELGTLRAGPPEVRLPEEERPPHY